MWSLLVILLQLTPLAHPKTPPPSVATSVTCPRLNFFNIRRQIRTDLSIDPAPPGWELVGTENSEGREDIWYPTIPAGAMIEVRKRELYLRCDYRPRNWVQRWVPAGATIEKKLGPYRAGILCWTFEGVSRAPVHREISEEEPIFLPCLEGTCELICNLQP